MTELEKNKVQKTEVEKVTRDFGPMSLKEKKKIFSYFALQRIDVGDEEGAFIYSGLDKMKRFSLFIDNPKGKIGSFLGFRYFRKPMLVAYLQFVTADTCGLYINGTENVEWGRKKKQELEEKFSLKVDLACLEAKPIFKKKKLDFMRLKRM